MINKKEKEIKKLMKKRTLLSMLLAGIMAVSLVGCGDDGKSNNNNNITDKFQPTSTDTAVNGTEATTDVVEKPTEIETTTPEPEKNVITLMSADGKKVIHEFDIPEGYTVVSDKKSNHVELAKDDNEFIKIEIISGVNKTLLSTFASTSYSADNSYSRENFIKDWSERLGVDESAFNETIPEKVQGGMTPQFAVMNVYSEQRNLDAMYAEDAWITTNHTENSKYFTEGSRYFYGIDPYESIKGQTYLPANETFTIKVTHIFNEEYSDKIHEYLIDDSLSEKIFKFEQDADQEKIDIMVELFDNIKHKCDYCEFNK